MKAGETRESRWKGIFFAQGRCATRLRYAPTFQVPNFTANSNDTRRPSFVFVAKTVPVGLEFVSGGNWEPNEVPTVGDPPDTSEIGRGHWLSTGEGQRRTAVQRRVTACRVVVHLELDKLALQVTGIPKQDVVEEFAPHRPDQGLHEWVGQRLRVRGISQSNKRTVQGAKAAKPEAMFCATRRPHQGERTSSI